MTHTLLQLIKDVSGIPPTSVGHFLKELVMSLAGGMIAYIFTWRPHATDGVQGFLTHALNTGSLGEDVPLAAALKGRRS